MASGYVPNWLKATAVRKKVSITVRNRVRVSIFLKISLKLPAQIW